MPISLTNKKNTILENIFSSKSWTNSSKSNEIILSKIKKTYNSNLDNYNHINTISNLKQNVQSGSLIKYFNYDGQIKTTGILLKIIFVNKNDIDDAILLIKNNSGESWKIYFNNYIIFHNINNRNDSIRDLFISFLPQGEKTYEDFVI